MQWLLPILPVDFTILVPLIVVFVGLAVLLVVAVLVVLLMEGPETAWERRR